MVQLVLLVRDLERPELLAQVRQVPGQRGLDQLKVLGPPELQDLPGRPGHSLELGQLQEALALLVVLVPDYQLDSHLALVG
jgi:hypothetical protein